MANDHPDAPNRFGIRSSAETIEANKELLAKIDSDSILKAPMLKGSIYFCIITCGDDGQSKEELINESTALGAAICDLGIEIKYENKHYRWAARAPQALKILEYAEAFLRESGDILPGNLGVNAELKWRDEKDFENIIHLTQSKENIGWLVTRYA